MLSEDQELLQLMGNFSLETFQLPTPQEDLPAMKEGEEEPESDSERLHGAVEEAFLSFNAVQRAFPDAVV